MTVVVTMSEGGTIILPTELTEDLCLVAGDLVNLEKHDGQWVLRPTMYEVYTDEQIAQWAKDGEWGPGEKEVWKKRLNMQNL